MTPLQNKICSFIQQYIIENQYSPSYSEIATGVGMSPKSKGVISRYIHDLVKAGMLTLEKGYRRVSVAQNDIPIPLALPFLGRIAAGSPIEAITHHQTLNLGSLLKSADHFILEVNGDSMMDEGILSGDLVICRRTMRADENDIVVALIGQQEVTLKRLSYKIKNMITLIPANTSLKPKSYLPERVHIQGIFVGLFRLKNRMAYVESHD